MRKRSKRYQAIFILLALSVMSSGVVTAEYVAAEQNGTMRDRIEDSAGVPVEERTQLVEPRENPTVISTQKFGWDALIVFGTEGRLQYYNNSLDRYHDVDPVANTSSTVEFIGAKYEDDKTHLIIQQLNISTNQISTQYRHTVARTTRPHRWHDADRIDKSRYAIADIRDDSVFIINTSSNVREFEWNAQSAYDLSSGGPFPRDWTHINDVEYLRDGTLMVSLRNQDSVVFIEPNGQLNQSWTLGSDDAYQTLNEQHNPDFIPQESGGPAIIVADSQNDRIVEYQRQGQEWKQTWIWYDTEMSWPRDADRLPNGHTLIGDTNSGRVLEVAPNGSVVWRIEGIPSYDVERLGTGDESTNGPSAQKASIQPRNPETSVRESQLVGASMLPDIFVNSVAFVTPLWLSGVGQTASVLGAGSGGLLLTLTVITYRSRIREGISRWFR
jgi:hypothetical protein